MNVRRAIPTALSLPEEQLLRAVCRNRHVVEAGTLLGFSALTIGAVAATVTTIDRHEGYGPSTYRTFLANRYRFGRGNLVAIVGDCVRELPRVWAEVAVLDLTGDEALTAAALAALHPRVALVLVHDLHRVCCAGVARAIAQSAWQLVDAVDTFAVLVRRRLP